MAKKKAAIVFEHQFRQTYIVWSDLTNTELKGVDGVSVVEELTDYKTISIDMRYDAMEVLRELREIAERK